MNRRFSFVLTACLAAACQDATQPRDPVGRLSARHSAAFQEYQSISIADGDCGTALGVNDRDQVIGISQGANCSEPSHAFLWEKGVLQDLGTLGGIASEPTDINKHGQVVGWANTSDGSVHAFFWDHGSMED